ncbi:MAG: hypothetical protein SPL30_09175 [Succinivibrio sp.]|nr:hypothetical protein [Succinivibrio sp.]
MSDQITETQTSAEEAGYPSQNNPKEIVPWLKKQAENFNKYEQAAQQAREASAMIKEALPETKISLLIKRAILHLFCSAGFSAFAMLVIFAVLLAIAEFYNPNLYIFDLWMNYWKEFWVGLYVVIYLFLVFREIKRRNFFKLGVQAKQQEIADCVNTLTSDECKSFYNYVIPFMGPSYCYSAAANYFARLFLDGRCSNLQDCKNLYEQDKHAAEQRQQFQTICNEMAETKYLAGAAMSRANSALAASAFATLTALSASSRASAAESSLEDIKRSL